MTSFDSRKTGWTIEDCVEECREMGDDPENQVYYVMYSDVYHTNPECPHIQDSENLHVASSIHRLDGPYRAGANRIAPDDLEECSWCKASNNPDLEELPIEAVRRRRRGELVPATNGHGWPYEVETAEANESLVQAFSEVRDAANLSDVEDGDRIGTLYVESESRVVRDWNLKDDVKNDAAEATR